MLACALSTGCASNAVPESAVKPEPSSFASDPIDIDDFAEVAAEANAKAAEEERARQEHEAAWRERFPVDDYSNTLLIGDSLMQNATASLSEAMPGVSINADAGRTLETGGLVIDGESPDAGVLDQVRNDGGWYERYVIGTGNNDAYGLTMEAAEEIVDCLGSDKEIYFITMCSLLSPDATDSTNQVIDEMVARYSNVHKIDWYGYVSGNPYDYLRDGVHAYRDREPDYAACIKDGLDVVY